MKIFYRQQFLFPFQKPFLARLVLAFRAVPVAAGMMYDQDIATILASIAVRAQGLGAARCDCFYDF